MNTTNRLQQILNYFKNLVLNASGSERDFYSLLENGDVEKALSLFKNNTTDVDNAIKEYNPQTHKVMSRPNKPRKNDRPYITEKLPRSRQKYINEVELFFLLGNPIKWEKIDGSDECFEDFKNFLKDIRFDSKTRQSKRLAGAETECAKLYHIYNDNGTARVNCVILARSTGYELRPLFDQYGNLMAFAYGYKLNENGKTIQHWDFQTSKMLFYTQKDVVGYKVNMIPNPTGKINVIYINQPKAWSGVEQRIDREEQLDSRVADTNNYFADPIATATADVIDSIADPSKPGKLIQLMGANSKFEYVNPPQSSELRNSEKRELETSILFDTFTPDFSYENLKGMGTLSGSAIRNSMILGYIKRENLKEIYEELIDREKNIILAILKYLNPTKEFDKLRVKFEFSEPFSEDKTANWSNISSLYSSGLISMEKAINMLALSDAPQEEIEKIKKEQEEKQKEMDKTENKEENTSEIVQK